MEDFKSLNQALRKGMDSPFFASVIIVSPDREHILLAKRKDGKGWTMPGGGANEGEEPKAAAIREAFEESNMFLFEDLLEPLHVAPVFGERVCHVFLAVLDQLQVPGVQNDPDQEVRQWIWHPISKPLPEPMSDARRDSCTRAIFELARHKAQNAFLDAMGGFEQQELEKGKPVPVGSTSSNGQYKKHGEGDWRRIGGHGDTSKEHKGMDRKASDKPLHDVNVKFQHKGKEFTHKFQVPAQSSEHAWSQVEGKIKALEQKIGPVKMTEKKISQVAKSLAENEMTGTNIDTTHHSMEDMASRKSYWTLNLKNAFANMPIGSEPRQAQLDFPWMLQASQVDQGIYEGYVKNRDLHSGNAGEVVFQIKKMTLPAMIEALKAKEYISDREEAPQEKTDAHGIPELIEALKEAVAAPNTVNLNFYKAQKSDIVALNATLKGLL